MPESGPRLFTPKQVGDLRKFARAVRATYYNRRPDAFSKATGIDKENLQRFIDKDIRLDDADLSSLYGYAVSLATGELLTEIVDLIAAITDEHRSGAGAGDVVPGSPLIPCAVNEHKLKIMADSFSGNYLTYRFSYHDDVITVSWLTIAPYEASGRRVSFTEIHRTMGGESRECVGVVLPGPGTLLQLVGTFPRTGGFHVMILEAVEGYDRLPGIVLSTTRRGQSYAARVCCEPLPLGADRERYRDYVDVYEKEKWPELKKKVKYLEEYINNTVRAGLVIKP